MVTSVKSQSCPLSLLIATILSAAVVEVKGCSCLGWGDTPEDQAEFILYNETYGPDYITMYTIATLVDETTFTTNGEEMGYGLNPDYYDDDGWEPMEFTYQNTSFAIKEILFNRDTASFPNGMVVQSDGTLTYEAITTLTCCVCGREFYANDVGKEMLLPISSYGGFSGCDTSCLIEDKFCSDLAILLREGGNTVFGDIDEGENIADSTELFVADEITSTSLPEADEQDEIEILSMSMPDVQLQDEDIISNEDDLVIDSSIISMSMSEVQLPVTLPSSTTSPESTAAPVDVDIMSTSIPDPEDNTIGTTAANSVAAPGSTAQAVIGTTSTASTGAPESTYVPSDVDTTFMSMPIFFEETATGTTESYQSMPMILEELSDDHYSSISMSMKSPAVDYIPPIEEPVQESITSNNMNTNSENNSNGASLIGKSCILLNAAIIVSAHFSL